MLAMPIFFRFLVKPYNLFFRFLCFIFLMCHTANNIIVVFLFSVDWFSFTTTKIASLFHYIAIFQFFLRNDFLTKLYNKKHTGMVQWWHFLYYTLSGIHFKQKPLISHILRNLVKCK